MDVSRGHMHILQGYYLKPKTQKRKEGLNLIICLLTQQG